jgi:predicted translin family RNA/ssDNA-binding protein
MLIDKETRKKLKQIKKEISQLKKQIKNLPKNQPLTSAFFISSSLSNQLTNVIWQ